jgi:hypothetical protein
MKTFLKRLALGFILVLPWIGAASAQNVNVQNLNNVTPTDCSIALSSGGTAQNIITADKGVHGFILMNIDNTNGSGEPVWISFTGTAAAGASGSYALAAPTATTYALPGSFAAPLGFGTNKNVSVVAATTGHIITCTRW